MEGRKAETWFGLGALLVAIVATLLMLSTGKEQITDEWWLIAIIVCLLVLTLATVVVGGWWLVDEKPDELQLKILAALIALQPGPLGQTGGTRSAGRSGGTPPNQPSSPEGPTGPTGSAVPSGPEEEGVSRAALEGATGASGPTFDSALHNLEAENLVELRGDRVVRKEFVLDDRGRVAGVEVVYESGRNDATVYPETVGKRRERDNREEPIDS